MPNNEHETESSKIFLAVLIGIVAVGALALLVGGFFLLFAGVSSGPTYVHTSRMTAVATMPASASISTTMPASGGASTIRREVTAEGVVIEVYEAAVAAPETMPAAVPVEKEQQQ